MRRGHRWAIVLTGVLILAALPWAVSKLPAASTGATAPDLLSRVQRSSSVSYSGYAESVGSLALPATDQFNAITNLLGARTQMRVWWLSSAEWRVDTVSLTGETDLHHSGGQTWTWNYEANRATLDETSYPEDIRLPRSDDLLPSNLARRLLSQATPDEVQRLPSARVARQRRGLQQGQWDCRREYLLPAAPHQSTQIVGDRLHPATVGAGRGIERPRSARLHRPAGQCPA